MTTDNQIETLGPGPLALMALSEVIGPAPTLETLQSHCDQVAGKLAESLDAHHAYVLVRYPQAEVDLVGVADRTGDESGQPSWSEAVVSHVLADGRPVLVRQAMQDPQYEGDPRFQRFSIQTAVAVPLTCQTTTVGLLYADSRMDRPDWADGMEDLQAAARLLGLQVGGLVLERAVERQHRLAVAGQATLKLSHSIKNVLQMIGGAAEVIDLGLRTGKLDRVKCSWAILLPNVQRMKRLMLDMLDFSKDRPLNLDEADFNKTITAATETLHAQVHTELKERGIKVSFHPGRRLPPVRIDSERVHEMALNLMLNALDALAECDKRGGWVKVETWLDLSRSSVGLSVRDNGPGIPPELVDRIFLPFESGKTRFGTGLGMTIAKQTIDQHGGTIEVETAPGRGTTFTVYLPIHGPGTGTHTPN